MALDLPKVNMGSAPDDLAAGLIHRLARGEQRALSQLYAMLGTPLLRYLVQLAGERELAEEILQDTLLAIWRAAPTFQGRSRARTWCFGIARRRARDTLRSRAHGRDGLAEIADELTEAAASDARTDEIALQHMELARLAAGILRLPPIHREVLLLTFVEGLSGPEIASVLAVPEGTVKSRLSNARRALRGLLAEEEEA